MGENPYRTLKARLAELVTGIGLEQIQFTIVVGDEGGQPDMAQVIFRIDSDLVGADAAKVAEQAAIDAQFTAMMQADRAAQLDQQEVDAVASAKALAEKLAAEEAAEDAEVRASLQKLLDEG